MKTLIFASIVTVLHALCANCYAEPHPRAAAASTRATPPAGNAGGSGSAGAPAYPPLPSVWAASVKLGVLLPGSVNVDPPDYDLDTETGVIGLGKFDVWVVPWLSAGLHGLLAYSAVEVPIDDNEVNLMNLGLSLKGHFALSWVGISPGVTAGYQTTSGDTYDERVKGLGLGAFVEVSAPVTGGLRGVTELGFISQPTGGNSETDVVFGPIVYVTLGAQYGR